MGASASSTFRKVSVTVRPPGTWRSQEARGEMVSYLSDDDLWLPEHLERMAGRFSGTTW